MKFDLHIYLVFVLYLFPSSLVNIVQYCTFLLNEYKIKKITRNGKNRGKYIWQQEVKADVFFYCIEVPAVNESRCPMEGCDLGGDCSEVKSLACSRRSFGGYFTARQEYQTSLCSVSNATFISSPLISFILNDKDSYDTIEVVEYRNIRLTLSSTLHSVTDKKIFLTSLTNVLTYAHIRNKMRFHLDVEISMMRQRH